MTEPLFPCTNALQTPNPPFWTTKTAVPKFPQNGGSTPTPCLDKAVHAQGGGGIFVSFLSSAWFSCMYAAAEDVEEVLVELPINPGHKV